MSHSIDLRQIKQLKRRGSACNFSVTCVRGNGLTVSDAKDYYWGANTKGFILGGAGD